MIIDFATWKGIFCFMTISMTFCLNCLDGHWGLPAVWFDAEQLKHLESEVQAFFGGWLEAQIRHLIVLGQ